jgi:hypothetical protein
MQRRTTDHELPTIIRVDQKWSGAGDRLRPSLERLEKTKEFAALAEATGKAFKRSDSELQIVGEWEMRAQAFLRLSGVYAQLAGGEALPVPEVYEQYCSAFQAKSVKITYLAPLEFVEFSQDFMDFGQFQIRRFSRDPAGLLSAARGRCIGSTRLLVLTGSRIRAQVVVGWL